MERGRDGGRERGEKAARVCVGAAILPQTVFPDFTHYKFTKSHN